MLHQREQGAGKGATGCQAWLRDHGPTHVLGFQPLDSAERGQMLRITVTVTGAAGAYCTAARCLDALLDAFLVRH